MSKTIDVYMYKHNIMAPKKSSMKYIIYHNVMID